MTKLTIAELTPRFPDFRVALIVAEDLTIPARRSATLASEIGAVEKRCRERWSATELSAIPGVAAWRSAYRAFGIKKTSYRSSVERLIKRVLAGDGVPEVNALVDLYNATSIEQGLCLGCDDLDKLEGDLEFRYARPGDTFFDMSAGEGEDPLRSSQGGRSRLRRLAARAVPALELAPGRAHAGDAANPSARSDRRNRTAPATSTRRRGTLSTRFRASAAATVAGLSRTANIRSANSDRRSRGSACVFIEIDINISLCLIRTTPCRLAPR